MGTYLVNFIVYSMAMAGLLFVCLCIYKKTMLNTKCMKKNDELSIENALSLSQRKTLYVIKAGNEKFLIAADTERTTFLAKLDENAIPAKDNGVKNIEQFQNQKTEKALNFEKGLPIISQVQQVLQKNSVKQLIKENKQPKQVAKQSITEVKQPINEENQTIINVKRVDYSEVMSDLRKNSSKNKPVMKEMIRKLAQPIFEDEESESVSKNS